MGDLAWHCVYLFVVYVVPCVLHIFICCVCSNMCTDSVLCFNIEFFHLGEGGVVREHRTSLHAIVKIVRNEGVFGIYNG